MVELDLAAAIQSRPDAPPRRDGPGLLDELHDALVRYVVLPSPAAIDAVVLWIAATHAQAAWQHATRLIINSPEKRCGKSRLLDMIEATCHRPLVTVNATVPAIVRSIDVDDPPTIIMDEADTIFGRKTAENTEELRGLLNAGFGRGRPALRCVGPQQTPTEFHTFAMAALAAIGNAIPDTVTDRAVCVTIRRRLPGEQVAPFRTRRDRGPLQDLGSRLGKWLAGSIPMLEDAQPELPVEDREADVWEPLIATADFAGGDWPDRARKACEEFSLLASSAAEEQSLSTKLLVDLRDICLSIEGPSVASSLLIEQLRALPESPWEHFDFSQRELARRLGPYGVKSRQVRPHGLDGAQVRGYRLDELEDVFCRYLPVEGSGDQDASQTVTASHPPCGRHNSTDSRVTDVRPVTDASVTGPRSVTRTTLTSEGLSDLCDAVTEGDSSPPGPAKPTDPDHEDLSRAWHEDRSEYLTESEALNCFEEHFGAQPLEGPKR
jgi:hypothetical protein